jgi:hypothetical protein
MRGRPRPHRPSLSGSPTSSSSTASWTPTARIPSTDASSSSPPIAPWSWLPDRRRTGHQPGASRTARRLRPPAVQEPAGDQASRHWLDEEGRHRLHLARGGQSARHHGTLRVRAGPRHESRPSQDRRRPGPRRLALSGEAAARGRHRPGKPGQTGRTVSLTCRRAEPDRHHAPGRQRAERARAGPTEAMDCHPPVRNARLRIPRAGTAIACMQSILLGPLFPKYFRTPSINQDVPGLQSAKCTYAGTLANSRSKP